MRTALILLAALPLLATGPGNDRFSGRVLGGDGERQIADAIVTVTAPVGYLSSIVTNEAGEFCFESLPAGQYDFRVTAHGYAIYERQITVSSDAVVRELAIRLLVPADKQTVSIRELRNANITRSQR